MKKPLLFLSLLLSCSLFVGCSPEVKPTKLATPTIALDDNVVYWSAISNADGYVVSVNNAENSTTRLEYNITIPENTTAKIKVKAISNNTNYSESDYSSEVTYSNVKEDAVLKTPVLSIKDDLLYWGLIPGASIYRIYQNGTQIKEISQTSYRIEETTLGTYNYSVQAIPGASSKAKESQKSNTISYTVAKKSLRSPIPVYANKKLTWVAIDGAKEYEVYLNNIKQTTTSALVYDLSTYEYGEYTAQLKAIPNNSETFNASDLSSPLSFTLKAPVDLTKDIFVYSMHLSSTGSYYLGICDEKNYDSLKPEYQATLDSGIDNYLGNLPSSTATSMTPFAWRLEEVNYPKTYNWVHNESNVYRIRLADGFYLSIAKQNINSLSRDYISETAYMENDIWQYWQFIPCPTSEDCYYIYNVGHGYDWGKYNDYLTDTSSPDGGAELYPMSDSNKDWFIYKVCNVSGVNFDDVQKPDYSGMYTMKNFASKTLATVNSSNLLEANKAFDPTNITTDEVIILERGTVGTNNNAYRIKLTDGRYLQMVDNNLKACTGDASIQAQYFNIYEVPGLKGGIKIGGAIPQSDFCWFTDTNDNQKRNFLYSTQEGNVVSRWWGSIDHRNDMGNIWTIEKASFVRLMQPTVVLNGATASWDEVEFADSYEVLVNGVSKSVQTSLEYAITETGVGSYSVQVRALKADQSIYESVLSNEVVYSITDTKLTAPIISSTRNTVTWSSVVGACGYDVYVNNALATRVTKSTYEITSEGTYEIEVVAVASNPEFNSDKSNKVTITYSEFPEYVYFYSKHLNTSSIDYLLGIVDSENASQQKKEYQDRLKYMDNYLANMSVNVATDDLSPFVWKLEKVTYNVDKDWVKPGVNVYRIRLQDGSYLSVSKNNYISASGDYISSCDYIENDIWQYWQFIKTGEKDEYYIYNIGHGYDWGKYKDYLTDTSRYDGGAELYSMDSGNQAYFPYKMVEYTKDIIFEDVRHTDLTGSYVFYNYGLKKAAKINNDGNFAATESYVSSSVPEDIVFELIKDSNKVNAYFIKTNENKYLKMIDGYLLGVSNSPEQSFYLNELSGTLNLFKLSGAIDTDYTMFTDTNDNQTRLYVYASNVDGHSNGIASRWWGSIDHRNDNSSYWKLIPISK